MNNELKFYSSVKTKKYENQKVFIILSECKNKHFETENRKKQHKNVFLNIFFMKILIYSIIFSIFGVVNTNKTIGGHHYGKQKKS